MNGTSKWTPARFREAEKALRASATLQEAGRRLGGVSGNNIAQAFERARRGNPRKLLRRPELVAADLSNAVAVQQRDEVAASRSAVKRLQTQLIELQRAQDFYSKVSTIPSIKIDSSRPKSGKRAGTTVSVASDWHVGEVVTHEETIGRNVYNLAEARKRAAKYWDNVLWLREDVRRTVSADDHLLNFNGDMVSGSIHRDLVETNEVGLNDQVSECAAMCAPGIEALADSCRKLIVVCTHGNHARMNFGERSCHKIGWQVSLETSLYRFLRATVRRPNIEWIIPRAEGTAIDVHSWRFQFQHGTQIKSQGGIGGILVPLTRYATRAASAHYYVFGHFHQAECYGPIVVNGSLIGDSAYSKWHGLEFRKPEQVFFVVDERQGLRRFERVSVT
jgi:hypothetical protein